LGVSSKVLGGKGIMKFVIRRAVAGVVITPLVAGLWFALVVDFILLGGVANATPMEVWNTGLGMGVIVSLWFALGAVWKLVRK
jgi:TM2 domain-containing membrane protein YozV